MRTLYLILFICLAGFLYNNPGLWKHKVDAPADDIVVANQTVAVDMYSLSYCGPCKQEAGEMRHAGIAFRDYIIDNNQPLQDQLTQRLMSVGIPPGTHPVPILFVGRKVFIGYTPLATIVAALQQ